MAVQQSDIKQIIDESDAAKLVEVAKALGEQLAVKEGLRTSQLRNVFGAIRQTQMRWDKEAAHQRQAYREIILLQPKLAYFTKRTSSLGPLKDALDLAIGILKIDKQPNEVHFKNFVDFCEAIVAYHRFYRKTSD